LYVLYIIYIIHTYMHIGENIQWLAPLGHSPFFFYYRTYLSWHKVILNKELEEVEGLQRYIFENFSNICLLKEKCYIKILKTQSLALTHTHTHTHTYTYWYTVTKLYSYWHSIEQRNSGCYDHSESSIDMSGELSAYCKHVADIRNLLLLIIQVCEFYDHVEHISRWKVCWTLSTLGLSI
jgi:hypothetical protein